MWSTVVDLGKNGCSGGRVRVDRGKPDQSSGSPHPLRRQLVVVIVIIVIDIIVIITVGCWTCYRM